MGEWEGSCTDCILKRRHKHDPSFPVFQNNEKAGQDKGLPFSFILIANSQMDLPNVRRVVGIWAEGAGNQRIVLIGYLVLLTFSPRFIYFSCLPKITLFQGATLPNSLLPPEVSGWVPKDSFGV